jgi:hypothetical protein
VLEALVASRLNTAHTGGVELFPSSDAMGENARMEKQQHKKNKNKKQQVERQSAVKAKLYLDLAMRWESDDLLGAIACANVAQMSQPSSAGAALLRRLQEKRLAQLAAVVRVESEPAQVWEDANGVVWSRH